MGKKTPVAPAGETVILDASAAAREFRLSAEEAAVIVGSGIRVSLAWLGEYRARTVLDFTLADCERLTGTSLKTFHKMRTTGLLRVRTTSRGSRGLLYVAPAELVRVLSVIAAKRNATTTLTETPSQAAKRGESDRAAALAACDGD